MTTFDDPRGRQSEDLAFRAERAWRAGRADEARRLFAEAAELETEVAASIPPNDSRIRGVLGVSAVALWFKAGSFARAEALAHSLLADATSIDEPSQRHLRDLLERCWREASGLDLTGTDATAEPLEIKLDGGEIRAGIAPAATVRERQTIATSLLVRAAEWKSGKPFRVRGEASREISRNLRIFEAPAHAGSYGLRLYVTGRPQQDLPAVQGVTPRSVVETFLDIVSAAKGGDGELAALVEDRQYQYAFLAGLRDLAPDGTHVAEVTFEHPVWYASRPRTTYEPRHREAMTQRLTETDVAGDGVLSVEGMLKVVNLKARAPSIEVVTSRGPAVRIRIDAERFEGTIGPKLNKFVKVVFETRPKGRGHERHALDVSLRDERDEWPWEQEARIAVEHALAAAEWDLEKKTVTITAADFRGEMEPVELHDLEELKSKLHELASEAWYEAAPRDGGAAVFEAETDAIVENALDEVADKLGDLGWD